MQPCRERAGIGHQNHPFVTSLIKHVVFSACMLQMIFSVAGQLEVDHGRESSLISVIAINLTDVFDRAMRDP